VIIGRHLKQMRMQTTRAVLQNLMLRPQRAMRPN